MCSRTGWRVVRLLVWLPAVIPAHAAGPTWAKKATAFEAKCLYDTSEHPGEICRPELIPSPDRKSRVAAVYRDAFTLKDGGRVALAYLRVTTPLMGTQNVELPAGFGKFDLHWFPDSKGFFLNGNNGGGYWGFWVWVYWLEGGTVRKVDVMRAVRQDMLASFPPCRATKADPDTCRELYSDSQYPNESGIDWSSGPAGLVVMAEVPCSSSYGGVMCQVKGYVVSVPEGKIVQTMNARELKDRWQGSMAFSMRIPDPPEYK